MSKYETTAGYVTRHDAYAKLCYHLSEAEDQAYVIAHLLRTESSHKDELLAKGWRGIGQFLSEIRRKIITLGQGKLQ
jgi:hypothetical protein